MPDGVMGEAQFRKLVRQMRNAQKKWFRSKGQDREALETSKSLERQLDKELKRDEQPGLFEREGREE